MLRVLVGGAENFHPKVLEELAERYEVVKSAVPVMDEKQLCDEIVDADVFIMAGDERITPRVLDSAKKLKIVGYFGVGVDADYFKGGSLEMLTKKSIPIVYAPGANAVAVAEITVALIFDILKKTTYLNGIVRKGSWTHYTTWELSRKILGVVGAGNIGQKVARMLHKGLDMKIMYYDVIRRLDLEKELGAEFTDLRTLLVGSDIVTLHTPLLPQTRHMIGEQQLKIMKRTAYLVNSARAYLVDPVALHKALSEKWIAGAAFDAYYSEPTPRPEEDPHHLLVLSDELFLCTPHTGYNTSEANEACSRTLAQGINQIVDGKISDLVFNPDYAKYLKT